MTPLKTGTFNLRVYGVWINSVGEVLLTEEKVGSRVFVKFPGGGLEYGEGLLDCLKREWKEETGMDLISLDHYYTTDFFQASAFHPRQQVVSVYYRVEPAAGQQPALNPRFPMVKRFIFQPLADAFDVDLPIDRVVARRLQEDFRAGRL